MSENTNEQAVATSGETSTDTMAKVYATREECEAAKPTELGKKKLYCVTRPDGSTCWLWTDGYASAAYTVARIDGYTVSTAGKTKEVTKEAVAAKLASFTDEELQALGLSRKKGKK